MTKENILSKYPCGTNDYNNDREYDEDTVVLMLDEWAKQQALAFDIWKRENLYTIDYPNTNQYIKMVITGDIATTQVVPVDEVYNQFIEQSIK